MNLNIYLANRWQGFVVTKHKNKFILNHATKFWMDETAKHKKVASTVGHKWMAFAQKQQKLRKELLNVNVNPDQTEQEPIHNLRQRPQAMLMEKQKSWTSSLNHENNNETSKVHWIV